MTSTESIPELLSAAKANAQTSEAASDTAELKAIAIDALTVFEARMQKHFRRGPFFRKLKTLLNDSDENDLARSIHQYYMAVNTLKHGNGNSYRELQTLRNLPFVVIDRDKGPTNETAETEVLIDLTIPGFVDGLTDTLLKAHDFLEKKFA